MDALMLWITETELGLLCARIGLMVLGALILGTLMTVAAVSKRGALPWHVALCIVVGVASGMGAAHAGYFAHLGAGAFWTVLACLANLGVLISAVGTPRDVSEQFSTAPPRAGWLNDIVAHARGLNEMAGDWPELEQPERRQRPTERQQ